MAKKNKNESPETEKDTENTENVLPGEETLKEFEERITLEAHEYYHGYDFDHVEIKVNAGDKVTVSNAKAVKLIEDFPDIFTVVEE